MAYIEPQGISPVKSPNAKGLPAKRFLPFFGRLQKPLCAGESARSPGISPHILTPIISTASPTAVNTADLACEV